MHDCPVPGSVELRQTKLARRLTALIPSVSGTEQIFCESATVCAETNLLQVDSSHEKILSILYDIEPMEMLSVHSDTY